MWQDGLTAHCSPHTHARRHARTHIRAQDPCPAPGSSEQRSCNTIGTHGCLPRKKLRRFALPKIMYTVRCPCGTEHCKPLPLATKTLRAMVSLQTAPTKHGGPRTCTTRGLDKEVLAFQDPSLVRPTMQTIRCGMHLGHNKAQNLKPEAEVCSEGQRFTLNSVQ